MKAGANDKEIGKDGTKEGRKEIKGRGKKGKKKKRYSCHFSPSLTVPYTVEAWAGLDVESIN